MDLFMAFWLVLCTPLVVACAVTALVWTPTRRTHVVREFAATRSLVLDTDAAALAERLIIAGRRGRFAGALIAVAVSVGVFSVLDAPDRDLVFVGMLVGGYVVAQLAASLGTALAMHRAAPADRGQVRLAHLPTPSIDDFLPPVMRWWSVAALAVSTLALGAHIGFGGLSYGLGSRSYAVGWAVGATGVAATELAGRLLVRAPQPAGSPTELAVRDEITSDQLAVVVAGAFGPTLICVHVVSAVVPVVGGLSGVLICLPAVMENQRRRRVRERLWTPRPSSALPADGAP